MEFMEYVMNIHEIFRLTECLPNIYRIFREDLGNSYGTFTEYLRHTAYGMFTEYLWSIWGKVRNYLWNIYDIFTEYLVLRNIYIIHGIFRERLQNIYGVFRLTECLLNM